MRQTPDAPDFFEQAYLVCEDLRAQSGFAGDERAWHRARRPIAEAVDRDGSFLDIGCANGYLLESIVRWSKHRVEPYGLDFAPKLVELARAPAAVGRSHLPRRGTLVEPATALRLRTDGALLRDP